MNLAEVAGRLDIHNTSSGMAMMAHMPGYVQERFLAGTAGEDHAGHGDGPGAAPGAPGPDPGAWLRPDGGRPGAGKHCLRRSRVWRGPTA